jgi:hypothetical protein
MKYGSTHGHVHCLLSSPLLPNFHFSPLSFSLLLAMSSALQDLDPHRRGGDIHDASVEGTSMASSSRL